MTEPHWLSFLTRGDSPRDRLGQGISDTVGTTAPPYEGGQAPVAEVRSRAPAADRRLSNELTPQAGGGAYRELADVIERWDHAGISSGHAWAPCDRCRQMALMPRDGGRRCIMTPGCPGTHRVPGQRPTPLDALRRGLVDQDDFRRWPPLDMGPVLRRELS